MRATMVCLAALVSVQLGSPRPGRALEHADLARIAGDAASRKDAATIVRVVRRAYGGLRSFSAEGEEVTTIRTFGQEARVPKTFALTLGRPGRYLVVWSQKGGAGAEAGDGAAWNAGEGAFVYMGAPPRYAKEVDEPISLGRAQLGDVGGLFFKRAEGLRIEGATLQGTETIDGEECWVVSGSSERSAKETLWISTGRLVVLQHERSLKVRPDVLAKLGDRAGKVGSKPDKAFEAMGLDAEQRARVVAMMEDIAKVMAQHPDALDGAVTTTFRKVRLDQPEGPSSFVFAVPPGTPLETSALGMALGPRAALEVPHLRQPPPGEDARALLAKMLARYGDLRAFSARGETVKRIVQFGRERRTATPFTLAMQRPHRYRITWSTAPCSGADGCPADGALWNAGDGAFEYGRHYAAYAPQRDDESAFAVAAGVSSGLTRGVPPLFFGGRNWFSDLVAPVLEGLDDVDGEECWVVSGSSRESAKVTIWISRSRMLILQHRRALAEPADHAKNGHQEDELIYEHMKKEARPEAQDQVGFMADMMKTMGKHRADVTGDTTETYHEVRTDAAVVATDLVFVPPEGSVRKSSLQDDLFGPTPLERDAATPQRAR